MISCYSLFWSFWSSFCIRMRYALIDLVEWLLRVSDKRKVDSLEDLFVVDFWVLRPLFRVDLCITVVFCGFLSLLIWLPRIWSSSLNLSFWVVSLSSRLWLVAFFTSIALCMSAIVLRLSSSRMRDVPSLTLISLICMINESISF